MALLAKGLLPASFRGAPFAVLADEVGGGRRIALHQYPGKDEPWAEDMGRAARQYRFRGFIVDGDVVFAGGPIQLQRVLLLAALEKSGSGVLTHPTLGVLNVSVARFSVGEDLGAGRMSSVDVEFVESGKRSFPSILSKSTGLLSAANLCKVALAVDGVRVLALAASAGGRRKDLSNTAATWSSKVVALGADATSLQRLAAQLPGEYGRFAGGGNVGVDGRRATIYTTNTHIEDLVAVSSASRVAISRAAVALGGAVAAANLQYATTLLDAVSALIAALAAGCADPSDAIRLLVQLVDYIPPRPEALSPIGVAFSRAIRRAVAGELVTAVGQYQPTSSDDAALKIAHIGDVLDRIATDAADAGDEESFRAVRAARAAVVQDLRTRGSTLARVRTFTPGRAQPALQLAQRYYRDPARAAQLVTQVATIHPLFMPPAFQALAA
ncbi:MAG: DNA circularization N-terminal domain-containing protein [Pseudomonadota bacterium]|nr:DNA circularization N-terminal domain-containing protein [Pseudomonadota bacterium]